MKFTDLKLKNNNFLAPMAGLSDLAFRKVCREFGAALCYTEMVSAKALTYNDKKTYSILNTDKEDSPLCVQLFSKEPEIFKNACKIIEEMGFPMIDLNAGCPAPKIFNNGEGCALMKTPELIYELISSAVSAVSIPITIKIRRGTDEAHENAVECAVAAEKAGAAAITVHGRYREQYYSGKSDTGIIKKVRQTVKIPVIANGDVTTPQEASKLREETGCEYIMIGRGSLGHPFIFSQINEYEANGKYRDYSHKEALKIMLSQIEMMCEYKGENHAVKEARKHILYYIKGFKNAAELRRQATSVNSFDDVLKLSESIINR